MLSCLILAGFLVGALGKATSTTLDMDQMIREAFRRFDKNGDGIYTKAEAWAQLSPFDKNGDNQISKKEFYLQWPTADILPKVLGNMNMFDLLDVDKNGVINETDVIPGFDKMDLDSNGEVSFTEFFQSGQTATSLISSYIVIPQSAIDASFALIDTNNDKNMSFDEVWAYAKNTDTNGDDRVSKVEFMNAIANNTMRMEAWPHIFDLVDSNGDQFIDKPEVVGFYKIQDANGDGMTSKDEMTVLLGTLNRMNGMLVDLGLGKTPTFLDYGFEDADKNHDGKLTLIEEWDNIIRLDNNTDQKVSLAEFMTLFEFNHDEMKNAAQNVFRKYDKDNCGFFEMMEIFPFFKEMDINEDGSVDRNTFATFIEVIFSKAGADIRAAFSAQIHETHADFEFNVADTNHDGLLSVDELWASALLLDENGDGRLNTTEYLARYSSFPPNIQAAGPMIFDRFDFDKNDSLEKTDVIKGFPQVDTSGDGYISLLEYVQFVLKLYASFGIDLHSNATNTELDFGFDVADTNHDGVISVDEQWVQALKLDTNGDGKLSYNEFLTTVSNSPASLKAVAPHIFHQIDVDNSSFIEKSDVVTGFTSIDTSGDGKVQKAEYVAFFSQLYADLGVTLNVGTTNVPPNLSDYGFSAMDTNHDGQVTFEEQWAAIIILDTNGDNRVSQPEYVKSLPPQVASVGEKIFQKFDSDSNGFFEKVDIRRFSALVDTNGDGTVSSAEYTSFVATLLTSFGVDLSAFTTPRPTSVL